MFCACIKASPDPDPCISAFSKEWAVEEILGPFYFFPQLGVDRVSGLYKWVNVQLLSMLSMHCMPSDTFNLFFI